MLSNIRFSGITLIHRGPNSNTRNVPEWELDPEDPVLALSTPHADSNQLTTMFMYGKELYLFAHQYWGVEIAPMNTKAEVDASINAALTQYASNPQQQKKLLETIEHFIQAIRERDADAVKTIDLTM